MLKIKEVIREKGFTVQSLAAKLNISRFALSQQINGTPRLDSLQKIAGALDVNILDLFEDDREKNSSLVCPNCGKEIVIEVREK